MYTPEQQALYAQYVAAGYPADAALNATLQQLPVQAAPVAQPTPVQQAVHAQPMAMQAPAVAGAVATPAATNALLSIANDVAADEDHASTQSGGKARAGLAWIRVLGYVEIGVHQPGNPAHKPKQMAKLILELHHPDHLRQTGEPRIEQVSISKTHGTNSGFPKLFKHLRDCFPNEKITHMSQLLGRALIGTVYHNVDSKERTWVNFDKEGAWSFTAASGHNPDGTTYNVAIPELHGEQMLFLYDSQKALNNPAQMKVMWESIHIPGVSTFADATGVEQTRSLNQYQERLVKSLNWQTSEAKRVLDALGIDTYMGIEPTVVAPAEQTPALPNMAAPALPAMQPALQPVQPVAQPAQMQHVPQPVPTVQDAVVQPAQFVSATPAMTPLQAAPQQIPQQHIAQAAPMVAQPVAQPVPQAAPAIAPYVPPVEQQAAAQFNAAVLDPVAFAAQYQQ